MLVGFFLPWASGPGPFAATDFTGFTLVGFAGRLQALDLSIAADGTLWGVRLAILGVAVAATWQTLLAPAHRWHFAYSLSGWYIVASAAAMLGLGLLRTGIVLPPVGFALTVFGAVLFLAAWLATASPAAVDAEQ